MKTIVRFFILALMMLILVVGVTAQSNVLIPNTPTTGRIDDSNAVQIFTFDGLANSSATISISSEIGFALTMILSDARGVVLGQVQKPAGAATGVESLIEN
ncbi:MAG: hypothetical protein KJ043_23165, partial [Anaerolineae bacterium]|nr:hypothetical protein [Anaerolineae bacterium]